MTSTRLTWYAAKSDAGTGAGRSGAGRSGAGRPSAACGPSRRTGRALVGCGLALLPWLFVLAIDLPSSATAAHWPLAWVGLDALEAFGLIATGLLAVRRDHRLVLPATATAVLLVVDAWFDTTTAASGADLTTALVMAGCAELPLAVVCAVLAVRALPRAQR